MRTYEWTVSWMDWAPATGRLDESADGLWERQKVEGYPDEGAVQRMDLGRGGVATPPCVSYRSISSSRGVASPAMDMGVLSIMGLGDGRGVILWAFFRPSASFSFSHCSAILPQSTAEALLLLAFGGACCCCCGVRPLDEVEDDGVLDAWPW